MVKESAPGEQDAEQLKLYAPGVGDVRTGWTGTGAKTTETPELVGIEQLDAKALALVRTKALKLEQSAYRHSKDV